MLNRERGEGEIVFYKPKRRFIKTFLVLLLGLSTFVFIVGGAVYFIFSRELPQVLALQEYSPNTVTKVFSTDGQPVAEYYIERRIVIPMSSIPDHVVKAFLAAEDARFFEHRGINIKRIIGALLKNIEARRIVQGGSTITQQVVKTLLLTPEKSLSRKIKEAILAFRIERNLSKTDILHLYLNHIYLGNGAYGIQAAAGNYFGKDVGELGLSEATMLAGLPRAPTRYSPYVHPEKALERQRYVIDQMLRNDFITLEEAREALEAPIVLKPRKVESFNVAPYFTEHVRRYIEEKYGYDALYKGGLQIYTTLDLDAQKVAQEAVKDGLRSYDRRQGFRGPVKRLEDREEIEEFNPDEIGTENPLKVKERYRGVVTKVDLKGGFYNVSLGKERGRIAFKEMKWAKKIYNPDLSMEEKKELGVEKVLEEGDVIDVEIISFERDEDGFLPMTLEQEITAQAALIAIDPFTGEVKAMVGGLDFSRSQFNRAIQSRRQPGSAFKPIIYAAAMDKGFTPSSVIIDSPIIFEEVEIKDEEEEEEGEESLDLDPEAEARPNEEGEIRVWKPRNFDERFHGPTTLRDALSRSRNLVTIKLLRDIKVRYAVDYARRLGIKSPLNKDLSLALGSSGISLLELTRAYSVFVAAGKKIEPIFITRILDRDGDVLEDNLLPKIEEVISPETAFLITNMLQGVVERGTGWRAKALRRPTAGKTGTTNDYIDAWYVGYITDLVTGVWIGYDDERSLGKLETGSRAALPIWLKFMGRVIQDRPKRSFPIPDGVVFVRIDPDTGFLAPPGMKGAVFEAFKIGTVPRERAIETSFSPSGRFFELDQ